MLEPSILERIDDYRFSKRIGSRSEAIRRLIKSAIETEKGEAA